MCVSHLISLFFSICLFASYRFYIVFDHIHHFRADMRAGRKCDECTNTRTCSKVGSIVAAPFALSHLNPLFRENAHRIEINHIFPFAFVQCPGKLISKFMYLVDSRPLPQSTHVYTSYDLAINAIRQVREFKNTEPQTVQCRCEFCAACSILMGI